MDKKAHKREYMRQWAKTPEGIAYAASQREYRKQWKKDNKERFENKRDEAEAAVRMEALIHYSGGYDPPFCQICAKAGGLELRLSPVLPGQDPYWMRRNNWPEGFRVLCFSCVKTERGRRLTDGENLAWKNQETGKHHNWQRKTVACAQCGAQIDKKQCHLKHGFHFCGMECHGLWRSANVTGENHPSWNGGKEEFPCEECGASVERYRTVVEKNKSKVFCSTTCHDAWRSKHQTGETRYNWKGGYDPYYGPNWRVQKMRARQRDNHTCQRQECGKTEAELGRKLDVHHIIPFRNFGIDRYLEANAQSNLISYCNSCHKLIEEQEEKKLRKASA